MPRFMPNERQAACSAFCRAASTGPTSQAAANSSAVLARITARYSSSVVAVFLARASCITSPSAITAAADGENFQRLEAADLDHHLERLAEQEIADQHARLVAPQHARGEPAAPHLAFVDHVVVQQRRRVHELDRGGELDVAVAGIAGEPRHRQGQHRPQPLAARIDQVVGDLGDHRHLGAGARQDHGVDALHVGASRGRPAGRSMARPDFQTG